MPKLSEFEEDLQRVSRGSTGKEALTLVAEALDTMTNNVMSHVLRELEKPTGITPNFAVQAWCQIHGIHKLRKRLLKDIRIGESASRRVSEDMEVDDGRQG